MANAEAAPLVQAAAAASKLLDDEELPAAIVGGFAVAVRARPRMTQDVDFVAMGELDRLDGLARAALASGFSLRRPDAIEFAKTTRVLLLRHDSSSVDVDISLGALPFESELVATATRIQVLQHVLPVARGEDLVIMKALALRPRDVADIEGLVELCDEMDLDRVRRVVGEFTTALEDADFAGELEAILERLGR